MSGLAEQYIGMAGLKMESKCLQELPFIKLKLIVILTHESWWF